MKNKILSVIACVSAAAVLISASAVAGSTAETQNLLGDADGNGSITVSDATAVQQHAADLIALTGDAFAAADVNGDSIISVSDATEIQRYVAEISVDYAIGMPIESALPGIYPGETAKTNSLYVDKNGGSVVIPAQFKVSAKEDEQTVAEGMVLIGPDESEFVWVPTAETAFERRDFGSYFYSNGSFSGYYDQTYLESYRDMEASVKKYGGFYMGRYEASKGENNLPVSKKITDSSQGSIWVRFSPQDTTIACQNMYADNDAVQGFFPWGVNWDTTLQWLVDSGNKTQTEVVSDSTSWGNYSNDTFSPNAYGNTTGVWEEAKANNIYDLAGNNWEWTQERQSTDNYVMRGGGYNLMGGSCLGSRYPAAVRDPLPGNDHHPNVAFRPALFIK